MRKIAIITLLSLLLPVGVALAQESKRVEVTTIYRPEVAPAKKLLAPTTMTDAPSLEVDVEYDVKPETWSIELQDENFKAATATYWDYNRSRRGYMKLGVGAPLGSDVQLRYATQNSRVGYFGFNLCHDGEFAPKSNIEGIKRPIAQSFDMRNGIAMFGGAYLGRQTFEASLSGSYDIYNHYAELGDNPFRASFGDVTLNMRYGDDFTDLSRLNFAIELHGDTWTHRLPMITDVARMAVEFNVGGDVVLGREFNGNYIGVNFAYDTWVGNKTLDYNKTRLSGGVEYHRTLGIVDLEVGVGYMFDRVAGAAKASHFVLPRAKVLFDLKKAAFAPYVEFDTNVSQNGVSSLYAQNPYIDYRVMSELFGAMPNTLSYDLTAGFMGVLSQSRFAYRAYVGGEFMRDAIFWYVTKPGLFGVAADDNTRLVAGAEVQYRPIGSLLFGVGVHYRGDKNESEYLISEPRFMVDAVVEYRVKKFKLYAKTDVIGRREWTDLSSVSGVFATSAKVDLRAGIAFAASQKCEIYLDGYNLLNRKGAAAIYDYAYYYRNGIGFMAGVKVSF